VAGLGYGATLASAGIGAVFSPVSFRDEFLG